MADIQKLTYPYFTDGSTQLNAQNLNPIIAKINEVIDKVNGGVTPTQTVATPTISISGTTATISCSTSGATIRYAINGTPTESSGTVIANGGTVNLSSYSQSTVIRAIAYKSGMTTSQVAQETYSPSVQPVVSIPTMVLNTTAKTVALSATSGLTIKYSTNGGTPATTYSSPINVANGATIKAITTDGTTSSSVPKITVKFNEELNTIQFLSSQAGDIVYTTNGSTPNASSTQYSDEITPSVGTTYKVAVYNNGVLASEVATIQIAS